MPTLSWAEHTGHTLAFPCWLKDTVYEVSYFIGLRKRITNWWIEGSHPNSSVTIASALRTHQVLQSFQSGPAR